MATVTISLPNQTAKQVDVEAKKKGFATRSEFLRSLIREYFSTKLEGVKLEPFFPKPLEEIEEDLRSTGKYSDAFVRSVVTGLKDNSSYYEGKTPQP